MSKPKNKRYEMQSKDQAGRLRNTGHIDMQASAAGAELYLYGEIIDDKLTAAWYGDSCPQEIADFFAGLDQNDQVTIYFNSPGGDVFAGLAIHSILKRHKGRKIGHVDGMAASIASVILMGCDEILVNLGAQIMVHNPWTWMAGNANELRKVADDLDNARESMLDIYMTKTQEGVTREQVTGLLDAETWMRGEKAAEYFRVTANDTQAAPAAASAAYSRYRNTPAEIKNAEIREKAEKERADALLADLYLYGTGE